MPGRAREAERTEQRAHGFGVGRDQFGEGDPRGHHPLRQRGDARRLLEHQQRAVGVHGGGPGLGLPEDVVEDLQRQRPVVSGGPHMPDQPGDVEAALSREAPVVPAPLQHVQRHQRGVRQLQEEDLLAGDVLDSLGVGPAGENVEAVQAGAERGMVGRFDDAPRMVVRTDVPPPRQRLVRDPNPELLCKIGQLTQMVRGERVVVLGERMDAGADEHRVDTEAAHQLELVPGPPQIAVEHLRRHGLDVPHRLIEIDAQPQIRTASPDLLGRERAGQQIVLEDLHPVEAGPRGGGELLGEGPAEGDGGDGGTHGGAPSRLNGVAARSSSGAP